MIIRRNLKFFCRRLAIFFVFVPNIAMVHAIEPSDISANQPIQSIVFPAEPQYKYENLVNFDGSKTALFKQLKALTDKAIIENSVAADGLGHVDLEIHKNGTCGLAEIDFSTRQILALAANVSGIQQYQSVYDDFRARYLRLLSEMPPLDEGANIENTFRQRRARDQYWRQKINANFSDNDAGFPSPVLEYIYLNYIDREMCLIDAENTAFLKGFIVENGWPIASKHGPESGTAAWLFVQHADNDVSFQKEVLSLLEGFLSNDDFDASHYAYLYDRVAVNSGELQRYATQVHCVDDEVAPRPLETPDDVDIRRSSVGLGPLEDYLANFTHCAKPTSP